MSRNDGVRKSGPALHVNTKGIVTWVVLSLTGSRKAVQDVVVSMVPQTVAAITGFVSSALVARGLGPTGLGQYTLVLSVSSLAASLSDLGIGQTAIRYASRSAASNDADGHLAVLRWAFRLRLLLTCLVSLAAFALAPVVAARLWGMESLTPLIRFSLLTGIFSALGAVPSIYFQSLRRFAVNAAVMVGQTLVSFAGILVLAWLDHWTVGSVISIGIVASAIGSLAFLSLVPRTALISSRGVSALLILRPSDLLRSPVVSSTEPTSMDSSSAQSFAFYMIISTVVVMVTLRMDVWLMGRFLGQEQIGLYAAATRFTLPLTIVLGALNTALWPRASALTSVQDSLALLRKTLRLSMLLAVCATPYALGAPLVAPWLFGPEYGASTMLGQLLCARYLFAILACPLGVIAYSFGFVRVFWWVNLLQLAVVLAINVCLLPVYGPVAPAIALLANDVVGCAITAALVVRWIGQPRTRVAG